MLAVILAILPGQIQPATWRYAESNPGGFESYSEHMAFKRLLTKHGSPGAVLDYPRNPYYRDKHGRRCAFK